MDLPDKLNRKAVVAIFDNVSPKTWQYMFNYEKHNGLAACRTEGYGEKHAWYSTKALMQWMVECGHCSPQDFEEKKQPRPESHWAGLNIRRHSIAA